MYEIRKGMKQINGVIVDTFERDVDRAGALLEVESGTTGFCGGDREEGGRAYVRIRAKSADFFAKVNTDENGRPQGLEFAVSGDAEILALMESLHFAYLALMETCAEEND